MLNKINNRILTEAWPSSQLHELNNNKALRETTIRKNSFKNILEAVVEGKYVMVLLDFAVLTDTKNDANAPNK